MSQAKKISIAFPIALVFYELAAYLSNDMYLPALPSLADQLQASAQQSQLTLAAWFFGAASSQLFLGPMSDRFGRRPIFFGGALTFIISTFAIAFSPNIEILLLFRVFQGMSIAVITVAAYASIHEQYDEIEAIKIVAMMISITVLAPAVGPVLGGLVLYFVSWRSIFLLLGVWALVSTFFLNKHMKETVDAKAQTPLKLSNIMKTYWRIITNKNFLSFIFLQILIILGLIAWMTLGPFYVIDVYGYHEIEFGIMQIFTVGSFIVGTRSTHRFVSTLGPARISAIGLCVTIFGTVLMTMATTIFVTHVTALVISLMVFEFGAGLAFSPLQRLAIDAVSEEPMGARLATWGFIFMLSGAFASGGVSIIYDAEIFDLALIFIGFSIPCALLLPWLFKQSPPSKI